MRAFCVGSLFLARRFVKNVTVFFLWNCAKYWRCSNFLIFLLIFLSKFQLIIFSRKFKATLCKRFQKVERIFFRNVRTLSQSTFHIRFFMIETYKHLRFFCTQKKKFNFDILMLYFPSGHDTCDICRFRFLKCRQTLNSKKRGGPLSTVCANK